MNHQETFSFIVIATVFAVIVSGVLVATGHSAAMYAAQWTGVLVAVTVGYRAIIAAFDLH